MDYDDFDARLDVRLQDYSRYSAEVEVHFYSGNPYTGWSRGPVGRYTPVDCTHQLVPNEEPINYCKSKFWGGDPYVIFQWLDHVNRQEYPAFWVSVELLRDGNGFQRVSSNGWGGCTG